MKREELIKKIALEFNVNETEVSEYFDNIFESLTRAFIKNKNVNISDFGKFNVKTKQNEEGEKEKTVLFSPVKKFAHEINYNFNELAPVQIRILDEKSLAQIPAEEYSDDEVEEIILIDFEDERIIIEEIKPKESEEAEPVWEEILIPEEQVQEIHSDESDKEERIPEEILIHEVKAQDILIEEIPEEKKPEEPEEEILIPEVKLQEAFIEDEIPEEKPPEKPKEEILIPEETQSEISAESIPEEVSEEVKIAEQEKEKIENVGNEHYRILDDFGKINIPGLVLPEIEEKVYIPKIITPAKKVISEKESLKNVGDESERILSDFGKINIPGPVLPELEEKIYIPKTRTAAKKVITEVTTVIKEVEKKTEEGKPVLIEPDEEKKEEKIPEITEEKKEEKIPGLKDFIQEEKQDEEIQDPGEIIEEEVEEPEVEEIQDSESQEIINESIPADEPPETEVPKTNLQLEAELLKMLDERKKILEELKKLESEEPDDLIDMSDSGIKQTDEEPKLFDESTLDLPKQNIFIDEEGKALEDLLKNFVSENKPAEEQAKENPEELLKKETGEPEKDEEKNIQPEEDIMFKPDVPDENLSELQTLLGSFYEEQGESGAMPEPKEAEPQLNNQEMKIFDKLLNETGKEEPKENIDSGSSADDSIQLSDLEKMFVSFKTEKTDEPEKEEVKIKTEEKADEEPPPIKTETIKTYDDIFNLLEPNGKKKEEKVSEPVKEPVKKEFPPILKIIIPAVLIIIVIIVSILLYEKLVYKSSAKIEPTQVSLPTDSTKIGENDSVIYADTNKTVEPIEEDIVFEDEGVLIKESEKGFYIQYGNFENQFELAKKIKELKAKKIYPSFDKDTTNEKQIYRLRIGPYKSLSEAKSIIPKL